MGSQLRPPSDPKHGRLILQGTIQNHMRKLVEASEIALGPSQADRLSLGEILGELARPALTFPVSGRTSRGSNMGKSVTASASCFTNSG